MLGACAGQYVGEFQCKCVFSISDDFNGTRLWWYDDMMTRYHDDTVTR